MINICFNQQLFILYKKIKVIIQKKRKVEPKIKKKMACSKYEYVKSFQEHRMALLDTFMVIRIDGRSFTKFCKAHQFEKPNDINALRLINEAARLTMQKFPEIFIAYGQSDEYSFALPKKCQLFSRRIDKIETCIVSYFTACYVMNWDKYFPSKTQGQSTLQDVPSFDCRIIQYPNEKTLRDYFRWRQVDCHINNLYNTLFWCLAYKKKMKGPQIEQILKDTNSGQKNQMLFQQFNINYNNIEEVYRKGTIFCYRAKSDKKKQQNMQKKQLPTSIKKQLRNSLNNLRQLSEAMEKMNTKLSQSEVEEDLINYKELKNIQQTLDGVTQKYKQIQERENKEKIKLKQSKVKYQLCEISQDLIQDQFWDSIKAQ